MDTNAIQSAMFRLTTGDIAKGMVTAVIAAVVVALAGVVQQPGFDLFTLDWGSLSHTILNVTFATFVAYLMKNFFSNAAGQFVGKVG